MAKIYIAGPMTGLPGLNFDAFHEAAKKFRSAGFTVLNPAEINPDLDADWTECMIEDIKALKTCSMIFLLKGWKNSKGAQIEKIVAEKLHIDIIYQDLEEFN